jgi:hypothetical protein
MPAKYVYVTVDPVGEVNVYGEEWQIFERYKSLPIVRGFRKINQGKFHQEMVTDRHVLYDDSDSIKTLVWVFMRKPVL